MLWLHCVENGLGGLVDGEGWRKGFEGRIDSGRGRWLDSWTNPTHFLESQGDVAWYV